MTRAGRYHGHVVTCSVDKFTKVKWNAVYSSDRQAPCQWHKATPLQKKEACRLFVAEHMATLLQGGESA